MMVRPIGLSVLAVMLAVTSASAAGGAASGGGAAGAAGDIFTGFQSNSKDPIQVDAKTLETYEDGKQRISIFTGNVVVTRGPTVMKASVMKLYSAAGGAKDTADKTPKKGGGSGFTRLEATGPVQVISGDSTITGANAVVDMKTQLITLSGNVVMTKGKDVVRGDTLVVDMRTGRARVEGGVQAEGGGKRIQVLISPDSAGGAEGADATKAAATGGKGKPKPAQ